MNNLLKLQGILLDLTYAEMMEFAGWFANTDKEDGQPINDPAFWAFAIHEWANNAEIPGGETESKP